MFSRLHIRIIVGLGAVLMLFGVVTQVIQQASTVACIQEVHQKMHYDLAEKLVETWLSREGPKLTKGRVGGVFKDVLDANPQLSVYLLDSGGDIVCSSSTEQLQADRVALRPINTFLSGEKALPVYGPDPRQAGMQCLFSAAPIMDQGKTIGYMYVLLEGAAGRSVNQLIAESGVMWVSTTATVVGLLLVMAVGTLLVTRSTSRVRSLADQMEEFRRSGFTQANVFGHARDGSTDETNRLQRVSRQMAERIAEQISELQRASEFRRELVTNVSHDLRTPLASLQGYLESIKLKDENLNPEEREKYLSVALSNAKRLSAIVEEMNDLSRLDSGDIELKREPVTLQDLLSDALLAVQDWLRERGIELETSISQGVADIAGDAHLLNRAFLNIIAHIVRNASDGTTLAAAIRDHGEIVEVSFADPGRVIPEQELSHLFERFYQEEGNPDAKFGGTDMAITHRIITLHGGSIRAESEKSRGTTITVVLPRG